jgi:hypothetical protein
MVFAPDGQRFAYARLKTSPSGPLVHVLVRNLDGNVVSQFDVVRHGMPEALTWVDNRRLSYLVHPASDEPAAQQSWYVVHDARTGEVVSARAGATFIWNAQHEHVAFVSGSGARQQVIVDGKCVWPRQGLTRVHSDLVWSADGRGLAFVEEMGGGARLVVLVEFDNPEGDLTWPIPSDALAPGLRVFWAGRNQVVIGEAALKPKFAAGWERVQ